MTLLTSCREANFNLPPPPLDYSPQCGTLIPYTPDQQQALKEELLNMKKNNEYPIARIVIGTDYNNTRKSIRACLGSQEGN